MQLFLKNANGLLKSDNLLLLLTVWLLLVVNMSTVQNWTRNWDYGLYDWLINYMRQPAPEDVVIVEIDESSLTLLGGWPWDRHYHAEMIYTLHEGGAKSVAYNVIFSNASESEAGDRALSQAIQLSRRVVLPVYIDRISQGGQLLEILPAAMFSEYAALGHVNMHLDEDGVARSVYLREGLGSDYWPHFSLTAAHMAAALPKSVVETHSANHLTDYVRKHQYSYPYIGDVGQFQRYSFVDVLSGEVDKNVFKNKIVFVGVTATSMGDPLPTPLTESGFQMPAVEINANVFQAIRDGNLISEVPLWVVVLLNSLVLTAALFAVPKLSGYYQLAITIGLASLTVLVSFLLLSHCMLWFKSINLILGLLSIPVLWNALRLNRLYHFLRAERFAFQQQAQDDLFIHAGAETVSHFSENLQKLLKAIRLDKFQLIKNNRIVLEKNSSGLARRYSYRLSAHTPNGELVLKVCFDPLDIRQEQKRKILTGVFAQQKKLQKITQFSSRDIFFQQIRAVRQYQQQVQEARFLFESSIKMLGGGIIVGDVFGHVVFQNQHAESLLGDGKEKYLDMLSGIELSTDEKWEDVVESVLCEQQKMECEGKVGVHDVAVALELINVPDTNVHLLLVHIADITRVKNAQRARNEMIDFLSHDMRSPMTSLKAMFDQARNDADGSIRQAQWLDQATEKVNKSLHYTEQLLYLAKVESEDAIQMYDVDLYSVAQNALDSMYYPAKQRQLTLTDKIDDDCWVWGNGDLLERVLANLLSNAIKYGNEGGEVSLSITLHEKTIHVAVRNTGEPIPEAIQTLLFQPFQRSTNSQQKGIGLGLRFVDVTLKRHQSQIQLRSDEQFTEFSFELPALAIE